VPPPYSRGNFKKTRGKKKLLKYTFFIKEKPAQIFFSCNDKKVILTSFLFIKQQNKEPL